MFVTRNPQKPNAIKTKKYLQINWISNLETKSHRLMMSESKFLNKIVKDNPSSPIIITLVETTKDRYNQIFGLYDVNNFAKEGYTPFGDE